MIHMMSLVEKMYITVCMVFGDAICNVDDVVIFVSNTAYLLEFFTEISANSKLYDAHGS